MTRESKAASPRRTILITKMHSNEEVNAAEIAQLSKNFDLIINNFGYPDRVIPEGHRVVTFDPTDPGGFLEFSQEYKVDYIAARTRTELTEEVLTQMAEQGLKSIFFPTTSTPGVDVEAVKNLNISLFNTNVNSGPASEFLLKTLTNYLSGHPNNHDFQQDKWDQASPFTLPDAEDSSIVKQRLAGLSVGIVGFGRFGKAVAKLFNALGASVQVCSSARFTEARAETEFREHKINATRVEDIETLAKNCNVICNVAPHITG